MEEQPISKETQEYFDFLVELRESGITNMFGAGAFLEDEFPELNKQEAQNILKAWMRSFK